MPTTGPSSCRECARAGCSWPGFNDLVAADARVEVVMLTAFDGLTVARKR